MSDECTMLHLRNIATTLRDDAAKHDADPDTLINRTLQQLRLLKATRVQASLDTAHETAGRESRP